MEFIQKIFTIFNLDTAEKEQAQKDFNMLIRARTAEQLLRELPEEKRLGLNAENAEEVMKESYSSELIRERTLMNLRQVLREYLDFMLQGGSEKERKAIARVLREAAMD